MDEHYQIITPGKKVGPWKQWYKTTCPHCQCVFKFDETRIHHEYSGDDHSGDDWMVLCPFCDYKFEYK